MSPNVASRRAVFIASLVGGASVQDAARASGVSERTGQRWHRLPEVRADLRRLSDDALHQVAAQAASEACAALRVLAELRDNSEIAPAVRVAACARILECAARLRADLDIIERLADLEARIGAR